MGIPLAGHPYSEHPTAKDNRILDYPKFPAEQTYKRALRALQVELVKLQKHIIPYGALILVGFKDSNSGSSKVEQKKHLAPSCRHTLKQWTRRSIDAFAQKQRKDCSIARIEMFASPHTPSAPCTVVRADDKRLARINVIEDRLTSLDDADKDHSLTRPNPDVVFTHAEGYLENNKIALQGIRL
jgi:polyphosphate kinase 2 (PPK2 family)